MTQLRTAAGATASSLALGFAFAVASPSASADILSVGAAPAVAIVGAALSPVATSGPFPLGVGARIAVSFSASCAVSAPPNSGAADVDLVVQRQVPGPAWVDWATLAPTNVVNRFCTGNTTVGYDGFASASITAGSLGAPVAGTYRVQVRARAIGPAFGAALADRSIVVWN